MGSRRSKHSCNQYGNPSCPSQQLTPSPFPSERYVRMTVSQYNWLIRNLIGVLWRDNQQTQLQPVVAITRNLPSFPPEVISCLPEGVWREGWLWASDMPLKQDERSYLLHHQGFSESQKANLLPVTQWIVYWWETNPVTIELVAPVLPV